MRKTKHTISQELTDLRRQRVLEYLSTGYTSHREIARVLNVAHDTIDRDVRYLLDSSKADIRKHFESLPLEIKKCMMGLELTIKALTNIIESDATEPVHRLAVLTARMQAYRFKVDILDGKAQLEEAITFIDEEKAANQDRGLTDQKGKEAIDNIVPEHP
jgi:hypothetical protein